MNKKTITDLLACLSNNIELMFQNKTSVNEGINECVRPDFDCDYICIISIANQQIQGQIVTGFSKATIDNVLAEVM